MALSPVLLAVILALVLAQGIKIIVLILYHKQRPDWSDMVVTGGMPSTHSAVVSALVVAVGMTEGVTNIFVLSLVLAAIVIRDALGVRRSVGEEGKLVNRIVRHLKLKAAPVHYSLGHTPSQVAVGCLLGALCGYLVAIL